MDNLLSKLSIADEYQSTGISPDFRSETKIGFGTVIKESWNKTGVFTEGSEISPSNLQSERPFGSGSLSLNRTEAFTGISPSELQLERRIGSGGFGTVFKGSWNKTEVAIKVFKLEGNIKAGQTTIQKEAETWAKLHHPHVLQFLGADIVGEIPFFVMPYLENGNARDFIERHPKCNRNKILYHVTLALVYLHGRNVVHGDIKGFNVLIDNANNAVLCDFGIASIKDDVLSMSLSSGERSISGTPSFMAPERLKGGPLRRPCDVYAFGMLIYEVHANANPLSLHIGYSEFMKLVAIEGHRPDRPDRGDAPQLTDDIWYLAERCWEGTASARPFIDDVCDVIAPYVKLYGNYPANVVPLAGGPKRSGRDEAPQIPDDIGRSVERTLVAMPSIDDAYDNISPSPKLHDNYPTYAVPLAGGPQRSDRDGAPQIPDDTGHSVERTLVAMPSVDDVYDNTAPSPKLHDNYPANAAPRAGRPERPEAPQIPDGIRRPAERTLAAMPSTDDAYDNTAPSPKLHDNYPANTVPRARGPKRPDKGEAPRLFDHTSRPAERTQAARPPIDDDNIAPSTKLDRDFPAKTLPRSGGPSTHVPKPLRSAYDRLQAGATFRETLVIRTPYNQLWAVAITHDGKTIASSGVQEGDKDEGFIHTWDSASGAHKRSLQGHTAYVSCLSFFKNGLLVSGSWDRTVRVWDLESSAMVILKHDDIITCISLSTDNKTIATRVWHGSIRLWDSTTGNLLHTLENSKCHGITSISISSDSSFLVAFGYHVSRVDCWWVATRWKQLHDGQWIIDVHRKIDCHVKGHVVFSSCSSNGPRFALSGDDRLAIYGIHKNESYESHIDEGGGKAIFSPDGNWLVSRANYKTVGRLKIWDAISGKMLSEVLSVRYTNTDAVFISHDGSRILAGDGQSLRVFVLTDI